MTETTNRTGIAPPWKILIADDDADVHESTRFALHAASFRGRKLEFLDAYDGAQTLTVLRSNPDIAIVLLDVVMETDDAGLSAVHRIREEGFKLVRIIIRTGFPGQAPEREVIVNYDIHDYKEKTGAAAKQLFSTVVSALRSYADLRLLESHHRGLLRVLEAVSWFDFSAVQRYVSGLLTEFTEIARLNPGELVICSRRSDDDLSVPFVVAALDSNDSEGVALTVGEIASPAAKLILDSFAQRGANSSGAGETLFVRSHDIDLVAFAAGAGAFAQADRVLLNVFLVKACQAISNHATFTALEKDRDAVFRSLALMAERWHDGGAAELDRLAQLSTQIATRLETTLAYPGQVTRQFCRDIAVASALHDLGNAGLPASLLGSAQVWGADERALMQTHTDKGITALDETFCGNASSRCVAMAREIVQSHHERWDGSGYPNGLKGEAIPLSAQIVGIADSYVALTSPRPHRAAMTPAEARSCVAAGAQFSPLLIGALGEALASENF